MVKKKELKMAKIDVYPLAIRVIINPQWYPTPRKNIPIDVEGTVLTITTTRKKPTNLLKKGDYIELILNDLYSNSCSIKVRWDNDTKAELQAGSVIIRSAQISFCMTIWDNYLPPIDKRPYYKLLPKYYRSPTFLSYTSTKLSKLKIINDFPDTIKHSYPTATNDSFQNSADYDAIAHQIDTAYATRYCVEFDQEPEYKQITVEHYIDHTQGETHKQTIAQKSAYYKKSNVVNKQENDNYKLEVFNFSNNASKSINSKFKKYIKLTDTLHQMSNNAPPLKYQ